MQEERRRALRLVATPRVQHGDCSFVCVHSIPPDALSLLQIVWLCAAFRRSASHRRGGSWGEAIVLGSQTPETGCVRRAVTLAIAACLRRPADGSCGPDRRPGAALAALALLVVACLMPVAAWAADFTVSNGNDSGAGSLRQAIFDSNAAGGSNTITINGAVGTITLTQSLPMITASVAVTGNNTILDANNTGPRHLSCRPARCRYRTSRSTMPWPMRGNGGDRLSPAPAVAVWAAGAAVFSQHRRVGQPGPTLLGRGNASKHAAARRQQYGELWPGSSGAEAAGPGGGSGGSVAAAATSATAAVAAAMPAREAELRGPPPAAAAAAASLAAAVLLPAAAAAPAAAVNRGLAAALSPAPTAAAAEAVLVLWRRAVIP